MRTPVTCTIPQVIAPTAISATNKSSNAIGINWVKALSMIKGTAHTVVLRSSACFTANHKPGVENAWPFQSTVDCLKHRARAHINARSICLRPSHHATFYLIHLILRNHTIAHRNGGMINTLRVARDQWMPPSQGFTFRQQPIRTRRWKPL